MIPNAPEGNPPKDDATPGEGAADQTTIGGSQYNLDGDLRGSSVTINVGDDGYDVRDLDSPYLGLSAFTYNERERYGGRDQSADAATALIVAPGRERALCFVTGESGTGKSSFVQAGLLPRLEAFYAQLGRSLRYAVFRPSFQPLAGFAAALARAGIAIAERPDPAALLNALETQPPFQVTVLVIDQFEELLTHSEADQRAALLTLLANLPPFARLRTHIIATLRSDYLPEFVQHQALVDIARAGVALRPMRVEEYKASIALPLQRWYDTRCRFEQALLDQLAHDATERPTYLPLLQTTLDQIWRGGSLRVASYRGLAAGLHTMADRVCDYDEERQAPRTATEQAALIDVLLDLVAVLDDDPQHDVRRRRSRNELIGASATRRTSVDTLVQARILSTGDDQRNDGAVVVVEIIHETLIDNWDRLRLAIAERRGALQQRTRFEQALGRWQTRKKADRALLEGEPLDEAEQLAARDDIAVRPAAAREFLQASRAQRDQQRQHELVQAQALAQEQQQRADEQAQASARLRRRALLLAAALCGALVATLVALFFGVRAQRSAAELTVQLRVARAREALRGMDPARETLFGIEPAPVPERALALALAALPPDQSDLPPQVTTALYTSFEQISLVALLRGHGGAVTHVFWSSDGARIITGSEDKTVRMWDATTERQQAEWRLAAMPDALALSPHGQHLLVSTYLQSIAVWDLRNQSQPIPINHQERSVKRLIWSPDGRLALAIPYKRNVRIWSIADGGQKLINDTNGSATNDAAWSPDGTMVLTGGNGGMQVWRVGGAKSALAFRVNSDPTQAVAWSHNGDYLLGGTSAGGVGVWAADGGAPLLPLPQAHRAKVLAVAWSLDDQLLLTASADGTAALWDRVSGKELQRLYHGGAAVLAVAWSPDGSRVLTASSDNSVRIWNVKQSAQLAALAPPTTRATRAAITALAWSSDGSTLAAGDATGTIQLWQPATRTLLKTLPPLSGEGAVHSLRWNPTDGRLAAGYEHCAALIWDTARITPTLRLAGTGDIGSLAWSDDGAQLLVGSASPHGSACRTAQGDTDDSVRAWDAATGRVVLRLRPAPLLTAIAWHNERIITVSKTGAVQLWNATTGAEIWSSALPVLGSTLRSLAWSDDGTQLLVGSKDANVYLLDAATGAQLGSTFRDHDGAVLAAAWGRGIPGWLTASDDATLRLWGAAGEPLAAYGAGSALNALAASPKGELAATGGADGVVRLWLIDARGARAALTQRVCAIYGADDAALRAAVPGWDWPGCNAALRAVAGPTATMAALPSARGDSGMR